MLLSDNRIGRRFAAAPLSTGYESLYARKETILRYIMEKAYKLGKLGNAQRQYDAEAGEYDDSLCHLI